MGCWMPIFIGLGFWGIVCTGQKEYSTLMISAKTPYQVALLQSLTQLKLATPLQLNQRTRASVSQSSLPLVKAKLNQWNVKFSVSSPSQQKLPSAIAQTQKPRPRVAKTLLNSAKYLQFSEIEQYLTNLKNAYPNVVQVEKIGKTHRRVSIKIVKVGTGGKNKSAIWIDAGIHAREWMAPATALYMLNQLVTNSTYKRYLSKVNWYFLPMANPDSYNYSRTVNPMWRKNRRPGSNRCKEGLDCCYGVDLNRNFDYSFGGQGTSQDPCVDIYGGPSAFSEPESKAMRDFILAHRDIRAAVTLHGFSQMWFYPYGDKSNSPASDWKDLAALAKKATAALRNVRGTDYQVGTAADLLYPSGGGSDDWTKAIAEVKYVYCVELPFVDGQTFQPSPRAIVPTGEETWAAIRVIADEISRSPASGQSSGSGRSA